MKKLIVLAIFILFSLSLYAQPKSTQVRSDNEGIEGQVLIHSGQWQGNQSIGTWQDFNLSSNDDFEFRYTEGSENKIENYGYFDYFSEVGAKNSLILQGYTQIFDFEYESDEPLTPVSWYGWRDDINKLHTDYVLTSEYEKYSNQYQNVRINQNKENIFQNRDRINYNRETILKVDEKHTDWNTLQDKQIELNTNGIHSNKKEILKNRDNISINSSAIKTNADNIVNVDNRHTSWNKKQDKAIITNKDNIITNRDNITKNSQRITNVENRVSDLEKTQYVVEGQVRVVDTKNWTVKPFARYNIERQNVDTVGVRFTFKLGSSYEERRIEALENKLNKLLEGGVKNEN